MDKIWQCGVIRYLQKKESAPKEIHADTVATLGYDSPALSTVKKWAAEFKMDRESLEDDLRSGRVPTLEKTLTAFIKQWDDRCLIVNLIANIMSISHEQVEKFFSRNLAC